MPNSIVSERVVVDASMITSRGAGTAVDFGLMIVEKLFSHEKAAEISTLGLCVNIRFPKGLR